MKKIILVIQFLLFSGLIWNPNQLRAQDSVLYNLQDCYRLALKRSETIAIKKEIIKEAEGHFLQSFSGVMPDLTFSYSDKRQHGPGDSNFSLNEVPEAKLSFSQNLFAGFKEFASIAVGGAEKRRRRQDEIRAKQLLFTDVSDAFYLFLNYQEEIKVMNNVAAALQERIDELQKREQLGRSRPSEVASAEARLSRLEADLELLESQQEVSRQLLEFLTGESVEAVVDEEKETEPLVSEQDYLAKADIRPDVRSAYEAWRAALHQVTIAKAGFWPTVGLDGNYYTKRVGNASNVDWDITFSVDVPISRGTEDFGKVKIARAQENQAELLYQQAKRNAALEIKNAYTRLKTTLNRTEALAKALKASEKNFELQLEDYRLNLVNNLEVLQALEGLEDARRDFITVKNEAKRLYWDLRVAIGDIPYDTL